MKIVGNNCAGLQGKKESFESLLKILSPAIVMLQETKLYRRGTLKFEQLECFEKIRSDKKGGGLMTLIHKNFEPVVIPTRNQSEMSSNVLVVGAKIKNIKIRFLNAYGVQECAAIEEKIEFYSILEEEILKALNSGNMLCLAMDANAKIGKKYISGDTHDISSNGRLLLNLVERLNLVVVNSTTKCQGTITRTKKVGNKLEESVIDYFIVCQDFFSFIKSMIVDTDRNYVLTKYTKKKDKNYTVESDHNPLILEIDIPWNSKIIEDRIEIFNLRNGDCQREFFKNTNNGDVLTNCLINRNIKEGGKLWFRNLKFKIVQNFKKIRINRKKTDEELNILKLIEQNRFTNGLVNEINKKKISDKIFEKNRKIIIDQVGEMIDNMSNLSRIKMWKVKQKVCPKVNTNYAIAKLNDNGDLVTEKSELKNLYAKVYKTRLKHREIRPNYFLLKKLKNELFEIRIKLARLIKSENWKLSDLVKVTKNLKTNKAADPKGLINEIFKPGVAGKDLQQSLLMLCNKVKTECTIPTFMEYTNITSIFKNKGSKTDLNNDRGVFTVMTVRSVIDNLIYNDFYDIIDKNMSDSNVGGRKERNIRDNLFIVNGIINYARQENLEVDINLYDIAKCFDSMWYEETMNDLWDTGIKNDKFAVIAKMNETCNIAVKTPVGVTERFKMDKIEMQGTKLSNIKCSIQIDTLGKECYNSGEGLFLYKNAVYVPPLGMIDDIASFSMSGSDAIKTNAIINAKIESKKLEFGPTKCFNIHIGKLENTHSNLKVHNDVLNVKEYETYLGDVINRTGSNENNVENRRSLGLAAINQMMSMINLTSLGHFFFEIALILRDSILLSKLVFNSEVWYKVTPKQLEKLEQIDESYFRKIMDVPKTTPKVGMWKITFMIYNQNAKIDVLLAYNTQRKR